MTKKELAKMLGLAYSHQIPRRLPDIYNVLSSPICDYKKIKRFTLKQEKIIRELLLEYNLFKNHEKTKNQSHN